MWCGGVGVWVCEFSFASQSLIVNVGSYLAGAYLSHTWSIVVPRAVVRHAIGHFRVAPSLCFKARLSVTPLI